MAETVDDLTVTYVEDDVEVVKELEKRILTKGTWATVMYMFQEMNRKTETYDPPKATIRRYQKRGGVYRQQSKFNISSAKQGRDIAGILMEWFPPEEEDEKK